MGKKPQMLILVDSWNIWLVLWFVWVFSSSRALCCVVQQPSLSPGRYSLDVFCNIYNAYLISLSFGLLLMVLGCLVCR